MSMAKKTREPVKPIEPESNSSEVEIDASSEEEEELQTILNNTVSKKPSTVPDSSESDSEPDPTPKPITNVAPLTLSKRPAASEAKKSENAKKPKTDKNVAVENSSKKPKIVETESNSSKKTPLFQRLFSDDDEIVILNGIIDFEAKNKMSPTADMDAFLEFIKKKLHVDVSKKQLQSKIQKMRKRYENNKEKDRSSAKPAEKLFYELSDKLWGGGEKEKVKEVGVSTVNANVSKKTEKGKKETAFEVENGKKEDVVDSNGAMEKKAISGKIGSYFELSNEGKLLRMGVELFGGEEKIAGWEEWKKLEREEMELSVKQLDVRRAKMRLVLNMME